MACFLAPMSEAIVMTVVQKIVDKKAKKTGGSGPENTSHWVRRLGLLNKMLWGGSGGDPSAGLELLPP